MLAALTMAGPVSEILEAKPVTTLSSKNGSKRMPLTANSVTSSDQSLVLARRSVRFTANVVIREKYANNADDPRGLHSDSRQISGESDVLRRGSGQRARLRSLRRLSTTVNPATGSAQSQSARESVRYTADAEIRANYANNAEHTVALYMSPNRDFRGGDKSKRGSGHRAYLKSLKRALSTAKPAASNTQSMAATDADGWQLLNK